MQVFENVQEYLKKVKVSSLHFYFRLYSKILRNQLDQLPLVTDHFDCSAIVIFRRSSQWVSAASFLKTLPKDERISNSDASDFKPGSEKHFFFN